jgi:hypothetical protein
MANWECGEMGRQHIIHTPIYITFCFSFIFVIHIYGGVETFGVVFTGNPKVGANNQLG